jgi:regulator of RNase E activity RraA
MEANIEEFRKLGTSTVSDALDRLGINGQVFGIKPLDRSFVVCGRAFTVRTIPTDARGASVGDYIDDVPEGEVVVLDNAGRLDGTVWGDILTIMADRRNLGGTVIHGVCRDTPRSLELSYPIFSRGSYMRTGKDRVQADGYNVSCSLGDVRVEPGDLMLGDADGLIRIPRPREDEILAVAKEIEVAEERIRSAIRDGMRLDEARKQMRYFELQSRQ